MECKEVMNCEEAAEFLGIKPFSIRAYAQRGLIPVQKPGKDWLFIRNDLLGWLRTMNVKVENLEIALSGAHGFVQRLLSDNHFKQKVNFISNNEKLMEFARQEGFAITTEELDKILKVKIDSYLPDCNPRKAKRYQVYIKILKLNDEPATDARIMDINAWGARIESSSPLVSPGPVKLIFALTKEIQEAPIYGEMVWSKFLPADNRYQGGVRFSQTID